MSVRRLAPLVGEAAEIVTLPTGAQTGAQKAQAASGNMDAGSGGCV
jgi:hypothetical protein